MTKSYWDGGDTPSLGLSYSVHKLGILSFLSPILAKKILVRKSLNDRFRPKRILNI